jgi:O-antigen/teichoic acid export membrane protein
MAMLAAPLLYDFAFQGKYGLAEKILPICLLQATWVSLFLIAEIQLLCAERGKRLITLLLVGLLLNFSFNWLLIPYFGLSGAVIATSMANIAVLMVLYQQMGKAGCELGWGTILLTLAPISILGGPIVGMSAMVGIVFVAGRTNWLLDVEDRAAIDAAVLPKLQRLGIKPRTLWV